MVEVYTRKANSQCAICQKEIYRRPFELENNNGVVYCSSKCFGISCRKEEPCPVCNKLILAGKNKKTCCRACSNKGRTGITYKNRFGPHKDKVKHYREQKTRLLKERGKKCERCGYAVYQILQVHHQDRDRNHNDLDNLELLCPNCHAKEHYLKK